MPLYPYACEACGHHFEQLVSGGGTAVAVVCPECQSETVTRKFGQPARPKTADVPLTNCRGDGPPCGAVGCGRMRQ